MLVEKLPGGLGGLHLVEHRLVDTGVLVGGSRLAAGAVPPQTRVGGVENRMTAATAIDVVGVSKRFGAGMVVSEMIASRAALIDNHNFKRMAAFSPDEFPFAIQLAGCDPDVMAEAAKLNEDRGAHIIDINFGCPVKKVVGGMAGSALMREPELAARLIEAGVRTTYLEAAGNIHGFICLRKGIPSSHQDITNGLNALKELLGELAA